jgi:hypothetical protein
MKATQEKRTFWELLDLIHDAWWDAGGIRPPRVRLRVRESGGFNVDADMNLNWEEPPIAGPGVPKGTTLSKNALTMVAHHEREHMTHSPRTWEQHARWCAELAKAGFGTLNQRGVPQEQDIMLITNVYADLQVNDKLHNRFEDRWMESFMEQLAFWPSEDPLQKLFRRAHDHLYGSQVTTVDDETDKDAKQLAKYTRAGELIAAASIIRKYIERSRKQAQEEYDKAKAEGRVIEIPMPGAGGGGVIVIDSRDLGDGQPTNDKDAKARIARIVEEIEGTVQDLQRAAQGAGRGMHHIEAEALLIEAKIFRLYRQALKLVPHISGTSGLPVPTSEKWSVGDGVHRLDIYETVRRAGRILPGITTMKERRHSVDRPVTLGMGAKIAIAMDESGSVTPDVFERELEAGIGLIALAMERGWETLPMKFDDGVIVYERGWNKDHLNAMRWLAKRQLGGGTTISAVLETVKEHGPKGVTLVILTDTGIGDLQRVGPTIREIAGMGCAFRIFMMGMAKIPAQVSSAFDGTDVKFFAVKDTSVRLTEDAIKECIERERSANA